VIPVGPPYQYQVLKLLEKQDTGEITSRELIGVAFVPMVGASKPAP
jgi:protein-L-isoaspartate O-methyltransferase